MVAYAFSPIDLIPDFIPVLGYLDDMIIVPLGIALCLRMVPPAVLSDSRRLADDWLEQRRARPKNYVVAGVFVLAWVALAYAAWRFATGWRIQ